MNKSLLTNLISLSVILIAFFSPLYKEVLLNMGFFAFSGALTNWLAIHMLFEKVPFLYGSGVIPLRFKEFKTGIKSMIMKQFFTEENVNKFMTEHGAKDLFNPSTIKDKIDFDKMFNGLLEVVQNSSLGGMLAMFGGTEALTPMKDPFKEKMSELVDDILNSEDINNISKNSNLSSGLQGQIEKMVDIRLDELTPKMVKEIVQEMIREHLGWLVVWGGVFGGILGLVFGSIRL